MGSQKWPKLAVKQIDSRVVTHALSYYVTYLCNSLSEVLYGMLSSIWGCPLNLGRHKPAHVLEPLKSSESTLGCYMASIT